MIALVADTMGRAWFYVATLLVVAMSTAAVGWCGQESPTTFGIIYAMSTFSIVQTGAVLAAQRRADKVAHAREHALHQKIDGLIRGVKDADDHLIGIEDQIAVADD